jgi:hypothetical protein
MEVNRELIVQEVGPIEEWAKKIAQNKPVAPQEFLMESLAIRDQALKAYEMLIPRSKETREPEDLLQGAIEKAILANEPAVRERIRKMVYEGQLDPMAFFEVLTGFLKEQSPVAYAFQDLRQVTLKDVEVRGCKSCYACLACAACAACVVSGTVAAGATGAAGAAGVYQA